MRPVLGSLGQARPWRLPYRVGGTKALLTGIGATFAPVVAGHHLDLHVKGITPAVLVIPFTGAENSEATFQATINAVRQAFFQKGGFRAQLDPASGTQIQLEAFLVGSMAEIEVLLTSSLDVLASLGFASGQLSTTSTVNLGRYSKTLPNGKTYFPGWQGPRPVVFLLDEEHPAPEFSPRDIPGLAWWLRADLGATLSTIVQWDDQSGAGDANRNFVEIVNGGTIVPSDPDFGGQQTIQFLAQKMQQVGIWSNAPVNQPFTIMLIGKDDAPVGGHRPWIGDANINEWYAASLGLAPTFAGPPHFTATGPLPVPTDIELQSTTVDVGQPVFWVTEFNDPNSSTMRINSSLPEPTIQHGGGTADTGIAQLTQLALAWAFGTGVSLVGTIAEIIIVRGILPQSVVNGVAAYVKNRYRLPIAGPLAPPVNPAALPGLQLWLRGDLGVHGHVTHLADQSGSGDPNRDVENTGLLPTQPVRVPSDPNYNGQATLHFDGSQFLDMVGTWSGGPIPQPATLAVVGNDSAAAVQNFLGAKAANQWWLTAEAPTGYGSDVNLTLLGTTPDSAAPKILILEYNDPTSTISVNALTPENTGNTAAGPLPALELGGNTQGQRPLNGVEAEVLMWPRILTPTEKVELATYLARRYHMIFGP